MSTWLIIALVAGAFGAWLAIRRTVRVPCELDLEATEAHFHAHAVLRNEVVQEGDQVLVHGAPDRIARGEQRRMATEATVTHVSAPRRLLTRVMGTSGITELYDVGFEG